MVDSKAHLFWDSCVFYALLRDERHAYDVDSIAQFVEEACEGKCQIYASSIVYAELIPSAITKPGLGSFQDFVNDLQGAVTIIDASPNIMHSAGCLKDLPYRKGKQPPRRLGTPDAIILASAVYVRDQLGVSITNFHTFDDGKTRGPEGKMVPLLSYHEWCDGFTAEQMKIAQPVINLSRQKPIHPAPSLFGGSAVPASD